MMFFKKDYACILKVGKKGFLVDLNKKNQICVDYSPSFSLIAFAALLAEPIASITVAAPVATSPAA